MLLDAVNNNPLFTTRRLPSLYADFRRLKVVNEEGYKANVAAWKSMLNEALADEVFDDATCVKADNELLDSLTSPQHGRPMALDAVIDEMVADRKLVPLHKFQQAAYSIYGRQWGVGATVGWVLNTSGIWDMTWRSGKKGQLDSIKYVSLPVLDEVAMTVKAKLDPVSYANSVFTRPMFEKLISEVKVGKRTMHLTSTDIDCVVRYLCRDKPCMVADSTTVKFDLNTGITEQDRAVANLRETISQVSDRVDALSERINSCAVKAKDSLNRKNKQMAKYALKSRRMAEDAQGGALNMLTNLEQVLTEIDNASGHMEIVRALQSGVSILGSLNKAIGGAEKVGDLMDELKDQTAETDEIGREISQLASSVDDTEIDDELAELEQQEVQKKVDRLPETAGLDELVQKTGELEIEEDKEKTPMPN